MNPLHPTFYKINILNGPLRDPYLNFNELKAKLF